MKTLNERVYELLVSMESPSTIGQLASSDALASVPRMAIGQALNSLCEEKIISHRFINGKVYFSADPAYGECVNPSRENLANMSSVLNGLSGLAALLGQEDSDDMDLSALMPSSESMDYDPAVDKISFSDGTHVDVGGLRIGVPNGFHYEENPDESHLLELWSPDSEDSDSASIHMVVGVPQGADTNVSCAEQFAALGILLQLPWHMVEKLGGKIPPDSIGNPTEGFFSCLAANTLSVIPSKFGIHQFRIDWSMDGGNPPSVVVKSVLERWLAASQIPQTVPTVFNAPELICPEGVTKFTQLLEQASGLNQLMDQSISSAVDSMGTFLQKNPNSSQTKLLLSVRRYFHEFSQGHARHLEELLDAWEKFSAMELSSEQRSGVIDNILVYLITSVHNQSLILPGGNIGAYNSATDIVLSADGNASVPVSLCELPEHFTELFEKLEGLTVDRDHAEAVQAISNQIRDFLNTSKSEENYCAEYKLEGTVLAAYLGDAAEVVLPDFITGIGDSAFKGCSNLERIVCGENLSAIGFAPFENCPKLKDLTFSPSLEFINGPLCGLVFARDSKPCLHVYQDSYGKTYAEENDFNYTVIQEKELDIIVSLDDKKMDLYGGVALPVPDGFVSSLTSGLDLKRYDDLEHLKYVSVPADTPNGLSDYKDVIFSASIPEEIRNIPNAMEAGQNLEEEVKFVHVHQDYRTCTADKDQILIRYDLAREGVENGQKWASYVAAVCYGDSIMTLQFFINGNFSHRQQEYAVRKFASKILLKKTVENSPEQRQLAEGKKAAERKAKEEGRKKASAEKASEEDRKQESRAILNRLKSEELNQSSIVKENPAIPTTEVLPTIMQSLADVQEKIASVKSEYEARELDHENSIGGIKSQIDELHERQKNLGFFKRKQKQAIDEEIKLLKDKIAHRNGEFQVNVASVYRKDMKSLESSLERIENIRNLLEGKENFEIKLGMEAMYSSDRPLEWIVVKNDNSYAYLFSKYIIGYGAFHKNYEHIISYTEWLKEFEKKSFSEQELSVLVGSPITYYGCAKNAFVFTKSDANGFLSQHLGTETLPAVLMDIARDPNLDDIDKESRKKTISSRYWLHSCNELSELDAIFVARDEETNSWTVKTMKNVTNDELMRGIRPAIVLDKTQLDKLI